jgi:flavin reductase (DIM6/NTAB) family NADH-FMN oxidoreductase RutF
MSSNTAIGTTMKFAGSVTEDEFRRAMSCYATGITVMTTLDLEGGPYGVTATSFSSLSLNPPLVQWSLRTAAYSMPVYLTAKSFAVNILSADQGYVARRFATPHVDRFEGLLIKKGINGLPLIEGASAWIECAIESTMPGGDHTIIVGRVLRVRSFACPPLLHWRGRSLPMAPATLDNWA